MLHTILFILLGIYVVWSALEFRSLQEVINELKDDVKLINKKNSEIRDSIEKMENDIYSDDEFEYVRETFTLYSGISIPRLAKRKKNKIQKRNRTTPRLPKSRKETGTCKRA